MWICSLARVLWHRLVEIGNDDLSSCFQPWRIGLDLDVAMLSVSIHGLKLFTIHVIITVKTKDDARISSFEMSDFTKSKKR